jgi:hypothetical protein
MDETTSKGTHLEVLGKLRGRYRTAGQHHDNPDVVERINALTRGRYGRLLNFYQAYLNLERKEKRDGRTVRVYGAPRTPLAWVLERGEATAETKRQLAAEKARRNPFALKREIEAGLKEIERTRRLAM